ncbi:gliding motility-associated C-terminal domain-containing protein [Flagellimonas sp. S3867]|uniref:gliding motility-associated C-terminal domain-containing protein n=1 Tax=Flagellimonas sp. S3867 TaxID=2768063 RepID=UPI001687159B|nr:gliding motility-associated C-terminal domain-containing protein [Flagellimonas sp. S3867]
MFLPFLTTAQRRKNFIGLLFVILFLVSTGFSPLSAFESLTVIFHEKTLLDTDDSKNNTLEETAYTPAIGLVKEAVLNPCNTITYTYYVHNLSSNEEIMEFVSVSDDEMSLVINFAGGDSNNNDLMESDETWIYRATYNITPTDKANGSVSSRATVTAVPQGQGAIQDISDHSIPGTANDEPTYVDLSFCQPRVGLIKTGVVSSDCTSIEYTYQITNQTQSGQRLEDIRLTDFPFSLLDFDLNIPNSGDIQGGASNGFLESGETWIYKVTEDITTAYRITGSVTTSQAKVSASPEGGGPRTNDFSDDNSPFEDDLTVTLLTDCLLAIGLVQTDTEVDACETIEYTFTVTNLNANEEPLQNIEITTSNLGIISGAPDDGDTGSLANVLEHNESWVFTRTYNITPAERISGVVNAQSSVTGIVQGLFAEVSDDSHDQFDTQDGPTITNLDPTCQPSINILQVGTLRGGDPSCTFIDYTYTVTNTSYDAFTEVEVVDNKLGPITGLDSGDANSSGTLDPSETWIYTESYDIALADKIAGVFETWSTVTAKVAGTGDAEVTDLSHPTDPNQDDITSVDLTTCEPKIALIKQGVVDNTCSQITYTYYVTNESGGTETLQNIQIIDDVLGPIAGPPSSGDGSIMGELEEGEIWEYTATYDIVQADIDAEFVENSATVSADIVNGGGTTLNDDSDDNSELEDDPTRVDLMACQADIAITRTALLVDTDMDNCPDAIDITIAITNTGQVELDQVDVIDEQLGNPVPGPFVESINTDNVMQLNEVWTFSATYDLSQNDIDNSPITPTASVTAEAVGSSFQVIDSDQNNIDTSGACAGSAAIGLVKEFTTFLDNDGDGCNDAIQYTLRVFNTGGMPLNNLTVNDPQLGNDVAGPDSKSINGDDILDVGEEWIYIGVYDIDQTDVTNGTVDGQADVLAFIVGPNIPIADLSHPNDANEDGITSTNVAGTCFDTVAIGITKIDSDFIDSDMNLCDDQIEYTITVENLGQMNLNITALNDAQLGNIIAGPFTESMNADGVLEVGETWTHIGIYNITGPDITNGTVSGQVNVTAQPVGTNVDIMASDGIDVDISGVACADSPTIAVTRDAQLVDTDMDGCMDRVDFTLVVSNPGGLDLDTVVLTDDQLLGNVGAPANDTDDDGILTQGTGEEWTFTASYDITQADINGGDIFSRATVTALTVVGNIPVQDFSHPTDPTLDQDNEILFSGTCDDTVGISIIRNAVLEDSDADNCSDRIAITIDVTNEGNARLENVIVNDDLLVNPPTLFSNGNGNNILDSGETWTYTATYDLTQADIDGINLISGADVTAQHLGGTFQVSDDSHPTSIALDGDNDNDVSGACADTPAITLTRVAPLADTNADGCDDAIDITVTITNTGLVDLENIVANDEQLGNGLAPTTNGNGDNILNVGESWTYVGTHDIVQSDINNSPLNPIANVTADVLGSSFQVSDSDQNNIDTSGACADTPAITLTRVAPLADTNADGCDDAIDITVTITNTGLVDLENIVANDEQLGNGLAPTTNGNGDNILNVWESWTYVGTHDIVQSDINNSPLNPIANVTADVLGSSFQVSDSDQNNIDTSGACAEMVDISITRDALEVDTDNDNCINRIDFTITVINQGNADLDTVNLDDTQLGNGLTPTDNGNGDAILDSGEQWVYAYSYNITQNDIDNSPLAGQAVVSARHIGSTFEVSDSASNNIDVSNACASFQGSVTLLQTASLSDTDNDLCNDTLTYTYTINNPVGNVDYENVLLTDDRFGIIDGPASGDLNNNGILEAGETWVYISLPYAILQNDIDNSPLDNFSTVTAVEQETAVAVSDLSHPDNPNADGPTSTDLSQACPTTATPAIGLTKQFSTLLDTTGDGCFDSIEYNYSLQNLGEEDIASIDIVDAMLVATQLVLASGDEGNPNVLEVGETWLFEPFRYTLTPDDINQGEVATQASVSGLSIPSNIAVSDISDDNSYMENDITRSSLTNLCPEDSASIGLKKTASTFDSDNDLCDDSILYFFTVENLGNVPLEDILLEDLFLGITLSEPTNRSINNDNILDIGEQWNYNLTYPITQADIDRTFVENQAMVTAYQVNQPDAFVTDLSHETQYDADAPTNISISEACMNTSAGIGLIKRGILIDTNNDSCAESIQYTFTVANLGNQSLEGIVLRDDLLENTIEGPISGDENTNGILDSNEEWEYSALYTVTSNDLSIEHVENLATVTANVVGQPNTVVNDISDNDSYTEDSPTTISVSDACNGKPAVDADFKIFTGITPDGDGINDFFRIKGIENYPNNSLKIYNRWGVLVYEAEQYGTGNNLFGGTSFGRTTVAKDKELPSGTYFYILSFTAENPGQNDYTGYLYINRD